MTKLAPYNATWEALFPTPTVEFWFDFASNYSYLSVMRIEAAAIRQGVRIVWKPFLLGPIFQSLGWSNSPFMLQKAKGDYMWHDIARECHKIGVPWVRPSTFPRASVLPLRVALLGADRPWIGAFCQRIMLRNFAQDHDIHTPEAVREELTALGLPASAILAEALSDANKLSLREQTHAAQIRGIFGAPTFFVGDAMFWGNDRLDDALACASALQSNPYPPYPG
ncbi:MULTISPECIES: 2-hydroxychromene-2-carboxylate isomerase [Ralstonia]|jgi:2-hydroxychromene-2-carboxylate isomerase|uniref:2-hydroxychromene-2-carboxylate isomerase n=1 Tax=Ralstonia flaminis TaxID=3058597 RepID=A0ABN9JHG1_9RALS|nr:MULTISPECIES: 2-hydroxychromene-2-carboxylate isomerase [unclassified Ralstonia]CAJ0812025.1 2-hydroxychromene-2-carboxylate isomerase [Ralstonia sp. LMG 18101]